jgi:hypothetical protein
MSNQITVTLGRNDRKLTEFLMKQEGLSSADEIVGINIRNQLYALMNIIKQEV